MAHKNLRNQYFVPGEGIAREVITADICKYLDNDATVRPGEYQGRNGYYVFAYRNLTSEMIQDLKDDTQRWQKEQRAKAKRGHGRDREMPDYTDSRVHHDRHDQDVSYDTGSSSRESASTLVQTGIPPGRYDRPDYRAGPPGPAYGDSVYTTQPPPSGDYPPYSTAPSYGTYPQGADRPPPNRANPAGYDHPDYLQDPYSGRYASNTQQMADPRSIRGAFPPAPAQGPADPPRDTRYAPQDPRYAFQDTRMDMRGDSRMDTRADPGRMDDRMDLDPRQPHRDRFDPRMADPRMERGPDPRADARGGRVETRREAPVDPRYAEPRNEPAYSDRRRRH